MRKSFKNKICAAALAAVFCLVAAMPAKAQVWTNSWSGENTGLPNMYFGLRIGLAASHVNSDDQYLDGGKFQAGLILGGVFGVQLSYSTPIFLETGLQYVEKGGKGDVTGKKFTYDLHYLEFPIVAKYKVEVAPDVTIDPFFGGYLATGVGGKIKNFGDREVQNSFSHNAFKHFDGGLRLGVGVQFDLFYLEAGYDIGLHNICHDYFDSSKNGNFFLSGGVNF